MLQSEDDKSKNGRDLKDPDAENIFDNYDVLDDNFENKGNSSDIKKNVNLANKIHLNDLLGAGDHQRDNEIDCDSDQVATSDNNVEVKCDSKDDLGSEYTVDKSDTKDPVETVLDDDDDDVETKSKAHDSYTNEISKDESVTSDTSDDSEAESVTSDIDDYLEDESVTSGSNDSSEDGSDLDTSKNFEDESCSKILDQHKSFQREGHRVCTEENNDFDDDDDSRGEETDSSGISEKSSANSQDSSDTDGAEN